MNRQASIILRGILSNGMNISLHSWTKPVRLLVVLPKAVGKINRKTQSLFRFQ